MIDDDLQASRLERFAFPIGRSLTARILAVNLIPLLVLSVAASAVEARW